MTEPLVLAFGLIARLRTCDLRPFVGLRYRARTTELQQPNSRFSPLISFARKLSYQRFTAVDG